MRAATSVTSFPPSVGFLFHMEKINFKKEKIPFTQVTNEVLNNPNLSFKAKGLYAYLYSKPDGWDFESIRIAQDSTDGRDSVRAGLVELENEGYLRRYKTPVGKMVYALASKPMTENPSLEPMTENPSDGKSVRRKIRHISNKEYKVIKNISNKEIYSSNFEEFWKLYPKKIGKGGAWLKWRNLNPGGELVKKIFSAVETQKQTDQWKKDGGQFIPHPTTWLNQKRWEDEVVAQETTPTSWNLNTNTYH